MKQLPSGQHYGETKKVLKLAGALLSEAACRSSLAIPWHYHENPFFFYQLSGRMDEVSKKQTCICKPGTLLFNNWQEPHYNKNISCDAKFFHLEIEKEWFKKYDIDNSKFNGRLIIENPFLKTIMNTLHKEIKISDSASQLSVDGLLIQAFANLNRRFDTQKNSIPAWVAKVKEMIYYSLDEKITLHQLAKETGVHPVHLSKSFPKYFGYSFGDYIRAEKIEKAVQFLLRTKMSVSEISHELGFADQSHFIRTFKIYYGITPSKFRKN